MTFKNPPGNDFYYPPSYPWTSHLIKIFLSIFYLKSFLYVRIVPRTYQLIANLSHRNYIHFFFLIIASTIKWSPIGDRNIRYCRRFAYPLYTVNNGEKTVNIILGKFTTKFLLPRINQWELGFQGLSHKEYFGLFSVLEVSNRKSYKVKQNPLTLTITCQNTQLPLDKYNEIFWLLFYAIIFQEYGLC